MSGFSNLLIHSVDVVTPLEDDSDTDRHGNPIEEDAEPVSERWRIEPASTEEDLANRDTRVSQYRGFAPPTSVVTALSRVEWGARTLRVSGDPEAFYGRNALHHYEVTLEEVTG